MVFPLIINFGFWEILIVLLIILLLFGGKRIPALMKGIGQGISNFKKGIKEDDNDIDQ
jgi:sec-independent protein translocase protein TatA